MFDEGDYEVVDECTGEEDPSVVPAETDKRTDEGEKAEAAVEAATAPATTGDEQPVRMEEVKKDGPVISLEPEKSGEPDFTADVEMDPPEPCQGDSINEDAICLNASDVAFPEDKDGDVEMIEANVVNTKETDSVVEIIPPEHAWYEEKLNAKMDIFKERLSKLARVLRLSYPSYGPWLDYNKTSVYHLDPPRRCPLDKPHTNRWKFICSRKTVQESTNKEEDSAEGTVNKKLETVWRLGPTDGSGVNTDNASQYPPFVMRVVKVFEDFLQSIEQSTEIEPPATVDQAAPVGTSPPSVEATSQTAVGPTEAASVKEEPELPVKAVDVVDDVTKKTTNEKSAQSVDRGHTWLWLLVRSNSKDELMVFATGKKISESTMQKLKQVFEVGPGKDCNVKSLYCKSIDSKSDGGVASNITFLAGTEALDETVGGVKIQLAPKTNFWCNASGVEQLGAAVSDMLNPLQKITVMEVGCGLGLIGLMVASKCKKVIGLDAPSEVEEAEMTSELNKVENASYIMGQPNELISKMPTLLKNGKAAAIVNGNSKLGRDIEIMTALRKIPSLRRVVMITTLTKQSVRAIMELTRPAEDDLGKPFMPLRATLVDTLPTGPHFEVVIRMDRLNLQKIEEPWFWNHVKFWAGLATKEAPRKNPPNPNEANASVAQTTKKTGGKGGPGDKQQPNAANVNRRPNNRSIKRNKMRKQRTAMWGTIPGTVTGVVRNPPANVAKNALAANLVKNPMASAARTSPKGKDAASDRSNPAKKLVVEKTNSVPANASAVQLTKESPDSPDPLKPVKIGKSHKPATASNLKKNPLARVQPGRGPRLSGAQKRKRHWAMMEAQKQGSGGVSGAGAAASGGGASKGGNDEQGPAEKRMRGNGNRKDLRGRLSGPRIMQQVQSQQMLLSMAQQKLGAVQGPIVDVDTAKQLQNMLSMVIDQTNKLQTQLPRSIWDRIAPPANNYQPQGRQDNRGNNSTMFRDRYPQNMGCQDTITASNAGFGGNNAAQPPPLPLFNRPPTDRTKIMPAGMNPNESRDGQHPRGISHCLQGPPDYRKYEGNNWNSRSNEVDKNLEQNVNKNSPTPLMESTARPSSPKRPGFVSSSPRDGNSLPRHYGQSSYSQQDNDKRQQPVSSSRRQPAPTTARVSPPRNNNPYSEIFHRRPVATQQGRQQQQMSGVTRRGNSPPRRENTTSGRSMSPPKRFPDNSWDSNRGGSSNSQDNWNQRQQMQTQQQRADPVASPDMPGRRWPSDKMQEPQIRNDSSTKNDQQMRQQNVNQNKRGSDGKQGMWMSGGGNIWNSQQVSLKPATTEKQWGSGNNGQGPSGDRWNARGNDNYEQRQSNNRGDNWGNSGNKGDNNWMNLPNDTKDRWNDDVGGKSRWQQSEQPSTSNWGRDEKRDQNWSNKSNDNWQNNAPMPMNMPKPYWSGPGNRSNNDQSWMTPNNTTKSGPFGNWQGSNNFGGNNWQPQNYSGFSEQQRQNTFGSNNFKGGR